MKDKESNEILLHCTSNKDSLEDALNETDHDEEMLSLILRCCAKACQCESLSQKLLEFLIILEDSKFLKDTLTEYMIRIQNLPSSEIELHEDRLVDIMMIFTQLKMRVPHAMLLSLGVLAMLEGVLQAVENECGGVSYKLAAAFKEWKETKQIVVKQNASKQNKRYMPIAEDEWLPPENFRDIPVFPESVDINVQDMPFLRRNKVEGRYHDLNHYLDVQFRLLREDFIAPLREGVKEYIEAVSTNGKTTRLQDVRIYTDVQIISPICSNLGLCQRVTFSCPGLNRIRWESSKRLIFGSLVVLSADKFETFFFATVANRDLKDVRKGLVDLQFECDSQRLTSIPPGTNFVMAETSAYFEAYRHVLLGLQNMKEGDLPFEKYIVHCEVNVQPPAYLCRQPSARLDLRPLVDEDMWLRDDSHQPGRRVQDASKPVYTFSARANMANNIKVTDKRYWPDPELLHLDNSQFDAVRTALSKEFVIIQGPPGTGKTYIGLKIVRALLHNKSLWTTDPITREHNNKPLLVVCYTNHALDQFLEGIINFYKGDVLRLGGRSSSEIMKNYSIANKRDTLRRNRSIPRAIYKERTKTRFRVKALRTSINLLAARIESAKINILHEECLQAIISQKHFRNLISGYELVKLQDSTRDFRNAKKRKECALIEWLGYAQLLQQNTKERIPNTKGKDRETTNEDDLVDVINEIDAETQQRQTDGYDDEENVNENEAIAEVTNSLSRLGIGENTVAINVSEMDDDDAITPEMSFRSKNNSNEWEIQGRQKRSMKKNLKHQLRLNDSMNDTEVSQIRDIWNLSSENKWRLYRYWIFQYCNIIHRKIDQNEEEFKNACKAHLEIQMQEDKDIMKHATVIGMTTTCAAKYQPVLKELGPRIIVVEEAAEVLEAHVITTLSKQCEHLILIGDHQQLKPNPTVYKLAQNFNLDLSLFERMIKNKLEYNCLQQQHRMRPEIAKIMKIIYPSLLNHEIVHTYQDIKGVSKNVFFVDHSEKESSEEESRSRSNQHEAEYIAGLCKYLLLQGYSPYQITVLTLYSGQLFCLKQKMPKSIFDGVKITVVDNFQGEENDIIILSLVRSNAEDNIGFLNIENRVCVALSRAKKGFYVIGNFEMLARKNQLWKSITALAKDDEFISDGLTLYCQNHPNDEGIYAKSGSDFKKAPEGGCMKPCDVRLRCGHTCTRACHVNDRRHEQFKCMKPCVKKACDSGHRCQGRCSNKCPPCMFLIDKTLPLCGHNQNVPCSMDPLKWSCTDECQKILKCNHLCGNLCGESHTDRCQVLVTKDWSCGHSATIECYMSNMQCPSVCKSEIGCGHLCKGTCGQCFQGRLHKVCKHRCNRTLLCEHYCKDYCSNCPPCTLKCENRCIHSNCQKTCGEQCIQCIEKCTWQCPHFRCTKLCSQPCDRPRCHHRCSRLLKCGHRCIGVCGEPCLTLCKICNKDQITKIFSGLDDKPYALFVQLEDCSHVFEVDWLDKWMDNDSQTREKTPVKLKECPKCNKPIRRNVRYGNLIKQTLKDIETVKKKLEQRKSELEISALQKYRSLVSSDRRIFNELYSRNQISQNSFAAIENQIRFLITLSEIKGKYQNEVVKSRTGGIELLNALQQIDELHAFIVKDRSYFTIQETDDILREIERFNLLLKYSLFKDWKLKSDVKMDASFNVNLRRVARYLTDGNPLIDRRKVFVTKFLKVVEDLVPRLGLGLSDEVRTVLVKTKQLFKGYWYKCKNGK